MKHGRILTRIARIFANSIRANWRNSRQSLVAERKRLKNYFAWSRVKIVKQETRSFFRWMPTAIVLWAFGVIFAVAAVVCLLDAKQAANGYTDSFYAPTLALIGDSQHAARWF